MPDQSTLIRMLDWGVFHSDQTTEAVNKAEKKSQDKITELINTVCDLDRAYSQSSTNKLPIESSSREKHRLIQAKYSQYEIETYELDVRFQNKEIALSSCVYCIPEPVAAIEIDIGDDRRIVAYTTKGTQPGWYELEDLKPENEIDFNEEYFYSLLVDAFELQPYLSRIS